MINVPMLGELTEYDCDEWLISKPITIKVLDGQEFEITLECYEEDESKEEFHETIKNFLSIEESTLKLAQDHIYKYYQDILVHLTPDDDWYVEIAEPKDVWKHIQFNSPPTISRRPYGDKLVYVSLSCSCDWEQEHGLQIVLKQGLSVCKVGPFNGHLTNSDAYNKSELENVIYV